MNLYSIDIKICATAYIKAESEEEAMKIAKEQLADTGMELPDNLDWLELPITGKEFDSPDLPDVSLSPAMTLYGPWRGDEQPVEMVEEDLPEAEDEEGE